MAHCACPRARQGRLHEAMSQTTDDRAVLLFGETYHHPNIFYRSGFLAPDPVVLVDNGGDDTTLWTSRLEEGRARAGGRGGGGGARRGGGRQGGARPLRDDEEGRQRAGRVVAAPPGRVQRARHRAGRRRQ